MTSRGGPFAIRASHVLTMTGPPLPGGWIRVAQGRVAGLGTRTPPAGAVPLDGCIVVPGLVNAHAHLEFSSLPRPFAADGGLPAWIARVVAWRRDRLPGDDEAPVAGAVAAGLAESAAAGVTTIGDIATATSMKMVSAGGPRLRIFCEGLGLAPAAITAASGAVVRDLDALGRRGVPAGVSPHAPYSVAAALGTRLLTAARDRRLPAAMHLLESETEAELLARGTGEFRRLLESLGAWDAARPPRLLPPAEWITRLARAPRGIVVHATHIARDPDALARLARHRDRLCVAVCPRTTRVISGLVPPVAILREAGIRVCLGTDGRGSNPDLSILAECRTLVDAGVVSPADALAMATRQAAWALGFEHRCGVLTPGRAADLVVLRPTQPHTDPFAAALDPATAIVAVYRSGRLIHGSLP